ncbi:isocitrate/isopropylmalate dehydrogenase family protein [Streptomyces sp. NPDC055186]
MRIAVVPGDGIGKEVVPATLPLLTLLNQRLGLGLEWETFGWGADAWLATGTGLPDGALERLEREFGAVYLGALGDPRIPDMAHGRAILLGLRKELDLCVNYRPVTLPEHRVDIYRENTQGLYTGIGGTIGRSGTVDVAIDECVYTRSTVERFVRHVLRRVHEQGGRRVTLVHKANAVPNTGALWQDVFRAELVRHPGLEGSEEYVDAFCYHLVRDPSAYEAVLTSNLFGDIVSDIGAALMGGLGLAASASISPTTGFVLVEPVHGSAPDIAGKGIANPGGAALSLALLLDHIGHPTAAGLLRTAVVDATRGTAATPDLGGSGTTDEFAADVMNRLERALTSGPLPERTPQS